MRDKRVSYLIGKKAQEVLATVNPLGTVDVNGHLVVFSHAAECYLDAMKKIHAYFPRGYCDMVYFSMKQQGVLNRKATDMWGRKQYAWFNWTVRSSSMKRKLQDIITKLLTLTQIPFNENAFNRAWFNFCEMMEKLPVEDINEVTCRILERDEKSN